MAKFIFIKDLDKVGYKNADSPLISFKTGDTIDGTLECGLMGEFGYGCSIIYQNNYIIPSSALKFISGTAEEQQLWIKTAISNPNNANPSNKLSGIAKIGIGIAIVVVIIGILKLFKVF